MRIFATLAALTSLVAVSTARIEAVAAPKTIKVGEPFDIILMGFGYIQTVDDIAAAFGVGPEDFNSGEALGQVFGSVYLGPEKSNIRGNLTFPVTVPTSWEDADALTITTGVYSLYGAQDLAVVDIFKVVTEVGDETSEEYVRSSV
ncbi:hypothetical protein AJ80_02549 [Polytolypa hystricis UAMH7299]|uniref:Uncharacterized protein n=1 Tax=Polytolypa hystricis (strain UAMH7299) TaxID=1447883 RepID=A0A2B7YQY2_POLH7|nr:hypothetical protein AJ80_02549 [Polytolypa hystricis UAMH7299]